MPADPHKLLADTLASTFSDGARRAVLVIGAGLHHHLAAHTRGDASTETWRLFRDWNGLLKAVGSTLGAAELGHADPTATWESLVVERTRQQARQSTGATVAASKVEARALRELAKRLGALPSVAEDRRALGPALRPFRDVISLNFDRTLEVAIGVKAEQPDEAGRRTIRATDGKRRLWFPHGHVSQPDSMILGHRAYGMAIDDLERQRSAMKAGEREWRGKRAWTPELRGEWEALRRAPDSTTVSWMDCFLLSDLIFVGCGLDRGEVDLWWALHQRARNHALQPPGAGPRTLVVHGPDGAAPHLSTSPAGVTLVPFDTWDEAWASLIGPWWEPRAAAPAPSASA